MKELDQRRFVTGGLFAVVLDGARVGFTPRWQVRRFHRIANHVVHTETIGCSIAGRIPTRLDQKTLFEASERALDRVRGAMLGDSCTCRGEAQRNELQEKLA